MRLTQLVHLLIIGLFTWQLAGCTAITSATHDKPITPDPTKRTFGTYIDDERLETIAKVNLNKTSESLKQAKIYITVYNGVALLTGQVASNELRLQAGDVVRKLERVRQVHNELEVRNNKSVWKGLADSWIKTKVNSKLMANKDVKSSRVKVIIENGTVFLMGMMDRKQAERISNIAANTKRVTRVVRVIEYLD
ncbi:BON domain-containing protein [Halioxenophilus aromaticivorans]|uniref:BON domain-containing protein n=1 Tax=Halioxenophilus aromaticivorans TaxID=1306992 RepID=A0AAV3TY86_9ALTE